MPVLHSHIYAYASADSNAEADLYPVSNSESNGYTEEIHLLYFGKNNCKSKSPEWSVHKT